MIGERVTVEIIKASGSVAGITPLVEAEVGGIFY
jgi:hypothetical protein